MCWWHLFTHTHSDPLVVVLVTFKQKPLCGQIWLTAVSSANRLMVESPNSSDVWRPCCETSKLSWVFNKRLVLTIPSFWYTSDSSVSTHVFGNQQNWEADPNSRHLKFLYVSLLLPWKPGYRLLETQASTESKTELNWIKVICYY